MLMSQKTLSINKKLFQFHPYRVHTQQAVEARDPPKRIADHQSLSFVLCVGIRLPSSWMEKWIPGICMNMHQKTTHAKVLNYEIPNDRWKVMVWVGLIDANTIIRPYSYNQTVNQHSYLHMINQYVVPQLVAKYGQGANCGASKTRPCT